MGGIIARASLKYLKKYENQFGFYCSLGTPHLGYQNGTDNIIKAGMWLMRKFMKHHKSLDQLTMSDGLG
jgi:ribonuclease HIII